MADDVTTIPEPGPEVFDGVVEAPEDVADMLDAVGFEGPDADGVEDGNERLGVIENVESLAANLSLVGPAVVHVARGQIGVCETGQNGGVPLQRYVHAFWPSSKPEPWCAFFVSWCYLQATRRRPPWQNPGYVGSVNAWMRSAGRIVTTPAHGDVFGVSDQHMGLVVGADRAKRQIWTVEGNTSSGCVKGNLRPWSGLWFGRL